MKNYIETVKKSDTWSDKKKSLYIPLAFMRDLGYDIHDYNQVEVDYAFGEHKYDFCIHTDALEILVNFDKDNTVVPKESTVGDKAIVVLSIRGINVKIAFRDISMKDVINLEEDPDALDFLANSEDGHNTLKRMIEAAEKDNQILIDIINSLKNYELPENVMNTLGVEDKEEFSKKFSKAFMYAIGKVNDADESDEIEQLKAELEAKNAEIEQLEEKVVGVKISEDLKIKLENAIQAKDNAIAELNKAKNDIYNLDGKIRSLKESKEQAEREVEATNRQIDKLKRDKLELEADVLRLKHELANVDAVRNDYSDNKHLSAASTDMEEDPFNSDDPFEVDTTDDDEDDPFASNYKDDDPFASNNEEDTDKTVNINQDPFGEDTEYNDGDSFEDDGGDLFDDNVVQRRADEVEIPSINKFNDDPFAP